jgi:hypothetical protein
LFVKTTYNIATFPVGRLQNVFTFLDRLLLVDENECKLNNSAIATQLNENLNPNGTKKSPKACIVSFPASRLGMYLKEALPLVKLLEAEPPRMGSQPGSWEPVRARAVSFLSAIHLNPE